MNQLPGFQYDGPDPEGYLPRDEISGYMEDYVRTFSLPVRSGVAVTDLKGRSQGDGYTVQTGDGSFDARNVVVATGALQMPKIPGFSAEIAEDVHQIASNDYRNPDTLPDGKVLVVGSGQSGCQIAEELSDSGRDVFLCTSDVGGSLGDTAAKIRLGGGQSTQAVLR